MKRNIKEHFADLTNKQLISRIRNQKTVRMLEESLGDDIIPELDDLRRRDLDLGSKLTREDIATYFPGIKGAVDALLGIDGPSPNILIQTLTDRNYMWYLAQMAIAGGGTLGYFGASLYNLDFAPSLESLALGVGIGISLGALVTLFGSPNFYDPFNKTISLRPTNIALARGVMAHEYAHNVQDFAGFPIGKEFACLWEGMAEGVRNAVSKHPEASDDSVRYKSLQSRFRFMQSAYRLLAKRLGIKVKEELTNQAHWIDPFEKTYAYGTALFHMQEIEHGWGFYRDLINRAKHQLTSVTVD